MTTLGVLALIGICGLFGPLLSVAGRLAVPVVVGEFVAGVIIGDTGFRIVHPTDPTLVLLSDVGFGMLMLGAGMRVPLRDARLRSALRPGAIAAVVVGALAVPAGLLASHIGPSGHPAVYAVVLASGSAAIVLPIVEERGLGSRAALVAMAQVTLADIVATLCVSIVLKPSLAGKAVLGTLAVAGGLLAILLLARQLRRHDWVHKLRKTGKRQGWALDLRVSLIILFGLGWIAEQSGASVLIAGFGTGLLVAAIGGPKRLSTEVLGVAQGVFVPLFFVLLGAKLDVRALGSDPSLIVLALALLGLNVAIHLIAALLTRQPPSAGLLAAAQLGVPSAVVSLGLTEGVLKPGQGAAILVAAIGTLAFSSLGAALMSRGATETTKTGKN